jgi:hypothetical protein
VAERHSGARSKRRGRSGAGRRSRKIGRERKSRCWPGVRSAIDEQYGCSYKPRPHLWRSISCLCRPDDVSYLRIVALALLLSVMVCCSRALLACLFYCCSSHALTVITVASCIWPQFLLCLRDVVEVLRCRVRLNI